jgi:hypothetical protein
VKKDHQMAQLGERQVALRQQPVVLDRRLHRHQAVLFAVEHQSWYLDALQDVADRSLVAVEEIARVAHAQHRAVECAEVRYHVVDQPQAQQLQTVHRVVDPVASKKLQLLHPGGGE